MVISDRGGWARPGQAQKRLTSCAETTLLVWLFCVGLLAVVPSPFMSPQGLPISMGFSREPLACGLTVSATPILVGAAGRVVITTDMTAPIDVKASWFGGSVVRNAWLVTAHD